MYLYTYNLNYHSYYKNHTSKPVEITLQSLSNNCKIKMYFQMLINWQGWTNKQMIFVWTKPFSRCHRGQSSTTRCAPAQLYDWWSYLAGFMMCVKLSREIDIHHKRFSQNIYERLLSVSRCLQSYTIFNTKPDYSELQNFIVNTSACKLLFEF